MSEFISTMSHNMWLFAIISFIFAAVIGSFLNVVIHRLPVMMKREWQQECNHYLDEYHKDIISPIMPKLDQVIDNYPEKYNIVIPHSSCPKCQTQIKPWHNLPILGWLILKGKCAACNTHISARYPIIELFSGLTISFLALYFGPTIEFALSATLTFGLIILTGIDLDEMLLPDQITLPLLWLGLIINLNDVFSSPTDAIIGAAAGYISLWSVFWAFKLLTGKEGMGHGDFKLLAVFGAWLGWQILPIIVLLSSLVCTIVGVGLILNKKINRSNPIPFGPYLAIAGWVAMIWGSNINTWYLSTF